MKPVYRNALRALVLAGTSLALVNAAQAQWHGRGGGGGHGGYYHGGHRGGGWGGAPWIFGGLGLGLGLGLASAYSYPSYYAAPTYVYSPPPTVVYTQPTTTYVQPSTVYASPVPVPSTAGVGGPQPVIYPRNGQTSTQIGADSDACSQWAGQQPNATADRSVFNRGIAACMDARGYTLR